MRLRWRKRLIAFVYHSAIFYIAILGAQINEPWLVGVGIFDLLTFRIFPVVRYIQSKLITTTKCPNCHKPINLLNRWQCGCGYICPIRRHVFFNCQQCGKVFNYITCNHCGIGILT